MAVASKWMTRTLLVLSAFIWGWGMAVLGLRVLLVYPGVYGMDRLPPLLMLCGAALVASGAVVFAFIAAVLFPRAYKGVTAAFELAPWAALLIVLIGVLL